MHRSPPYFRGSSSGCWWFSGGATEQQQQTRQSAIVGSINTNHYVYIYMYIHSVRVPHIANIVSRSVSRLCSVSLPFCYVWVVFSVLLFSFKSYFQPCWPQVFLVSSSRDSSVVLSAVCGIYYILIFVLTLFWIAVCVLHEICMRNLIVCLCRLSLV